MSKRTSKALEKELRTALPIAVHAATAAGTVIRRKFGKFRDLRVKADASFVTEADRQAEKAVVKRLRAKFSSHQIVGEESGDITKAQNLSSPFRWHIDPLDGTTNFVHGFPMFCVSIGLEFEDVGPVLGVIYHPITGDLYTGYRGAGAFANKRRMKVSHTSELKLALLSTGFSMSKAHNFSKELRAFTRLTRAANAVRRTGSAALDLTFVATGQFDGFWERGLHSWDVTAALALLTEAGGKYTQIDVSEKPYHIGDETLVASNGLLHRQILQALVG